MPDSFEFLALPTEIRILIYHNLLTKPVAIQLKTTTESGGVVFNHRYGGPTRTEGENQPQIFISYPMTPEIAS